MKPRSPEHPAELVKQVLLLLVCATSPKVRSINLLNGIAVIPHCLHGQFHSLLLQRLATKSEYATNLFVEYPISR